MVINQLMGLGGAGIAASSSFWTCRAAATRKRALLKRWAASRSVGRS